MVMRYWEWELLWDTIGFVERVMPNQPKDIQDEVVDEIYNRMNKTLRAFHANHPAAQRQTKVVKTAGAHQQNDPRQTR